MELRLTSVSNVGRHGNLAGRSRCASTRDNANGQTTMAKKSSEPHVVEARDPANLPGRLKRVGGSASDDWNDILVGQVVNTLRRGADPEQVSRQYQATVDALIGIAPKDEIEGMIAAQLLACHYASMDCYRRAMLREDRWREGARRQE